MMFELLKNNTIKTAGFDITSRGDCERLSNLILEKTDILLSYNTLRRFFGLIPYTKPNKTTLNTLANYNGYDSFTHFISINSYLTYWTKKEELFNLLNENSDEIVKYVSDLNIKNPETLDLLITVCRELIHTNRMDVFLDILNSASFNSYKFIYSEMLFYGNSVGILFRNSKQIDKNILLNKNFLEYVFSIFVDYSSLTNYYGKWCEIVIKNVSDIETLCFARGVIQIKNYFELNAVSFNFYKNIDYTNFHPILKGRIDSINILSNLQKGIVSNNYSFDSTNNNEQNWFYFHELIFTSILSKNFNLMKAIKTVLSKHKQTVQNYNEYHQKIFDLMVLFYNYQNNKKTKITIEIEQLNASSFKYSYKNVIILFIIILKYQSNQKNKSYYYKQYKQYSAKLNYPLFSHDYLINYFS
jgi:hypothetical protein